MEIIEKDVDYLFNTQELLELCQRINGIAYQH